MSEQLDKYRRIRLHIQCVVDSYLTVTLPPHITAAQYFAVHYPDIMDEVGGQRGELGGELVGYVILEESDDLPLPF